MSGERQIAALFVATGGAYFGLPGVTRPRTAYTCDLCGWVPCKCEQDREAARARAREAHPVTVLEAAPVLYHCLCALCGARWTASQVDDCPECGGAARLLGGGQ